MDFVVHWGWMHRQNMPFSSFEDALKFYAEVSKEQDARLLGAGAEESEGHYDDGLTDEQCERVQEVDSANIK